MGDNPSRFSGSVCSAVPIIRGAERTQQSPQREEIERNRRYEYSTSSESSEAEAYSWVKIRSRRCRRLEDRAIEVGYESDGSPIWVGRASHNGAVLPCKVLPGDGAAFVTHEGEVIEVDFVEVLCGDGECVEWVRRRNGAVSRRAIECGRTGRGERLYVGRARHRRSLIPGKIQPSQECLYVAYRGSELDFEKYEVMVAA